VILSARRADGEHVLAHALVGGCHKETLCFSHQEHGEALVSLGSLYRVRRAVCEYMKTRSIGHNNYKMDRETFCAPDRDIEKYDEVEALGY